MGYYLEVDDQKHKAHLLEVLWGAIPIDGPPESFESVPKDKALVCVIENLHWDAAGLVYSQREMKRFADDPSGRPKTWLLMDEQTALKLARLEKMPDHG